MHLSVVIPVYWSEGTLLELTERLHTQLLAITTDFEIIFIEDGSPYQDWEVISAICQKKPFVKAIKLSRNFGQHQAITAGLDVAQGEWVIIMDCDLQDLPEEIPKLYQKAQQGYDVVLAARVYRQDSFLKELYSKIFYYLLFLLTGVKQEPAVANFGIYHSKVIAVIKQMRESIRFLPTMITWVGFRRAILPVQHGKNKTRKSAYTFTKRFNLALDILLSYSEKPLRVIVSIGFVIALLSFIFFGVFLVKYFLGQIKVLGYTSLILSIWFLSGVVITTLGIVGLYVGKTFENSKNRPLYVVEKKINFND